MINFVCVYHKSKKTTYSHDYVLKLKNMIARHYTKPHKFHCLSNISLPIETIPLKNNFNNNLSDAMRLPFKK